MDAELRSMLDRADELLVVLETECDRCLGTQQVSDRARNLTHEILDKLRSALDQAMRRAWEKNVSSRLSQAERERARIYFPISADLHVFRSTLGRGCMTDLATSSPHLHQFLLSKQPFTSQDNGWLRILNELAAEGKHVRLAPQKRVETRRITVTGHKGRTVSWNPSAVRFGRGVSIAGAPVDPQTQRIVPTPGVTETLETWVAFVIEGQKVNALGFCRDACARTRQLIEEMADLV
jgi:hypothetical protein